MGDLNELVDRARYRVGNPSAWSEGFDDTISEEIRALLDALTSLMAERDGRDEAWAAQLRHAEHDRDQNAKWLATANAQLKAAREALSEAFDFLGGVDGAVEIRALITLSLDTNNGDGV